MPEYNHQHRHLLRHLLRGHVAEKVTGRTSPGEGSARERGCHLVFWRATFIHSFSFMTAFILFWATFSWEAFVFFLCQAEPGFKEARGLGARPK